MEKAAEEQLKIAYISNNDNFSWRILELMREKHLVSTLKPGKKINIGRFGRLLAWADVAYYEWCGELLQIGLSVRPDIPTVARLHRFEVYTPLIEKIDWKYVDLVINNISHDYLKKKFFDRVAEEPKSFQVMPDGVSLEKFKFVDREFKKPYQMCIVGTVMPRKGQYELIRMFSDLNSDDFELNIIGSEIREYADNCKEIAEILQIDDKVHFKGHIKDIVKELQANDIIVSNSRDEGNNTVMKEAMATGCYPLVNNWLGARLTYDKQYIFTKASDFIAHVNDWKVSKHKKLSSTNARKIIERDYDIEESAKLVLHEVERIARQPKRL